MYRNLARLPTGVRPANWPKLAQLSRGIHGSQRVQEITLLRMPAMSPTMTEGGVSRWDKKEGEAFSAGDVLLEIETDKAQMDVEAQDDGILAKILTPPNQGKVAVNSPIAILAEEGDDLTNLPSVESLTTASSESSTSPAPDAPSASSPSTDGPRGTSPDPSVPLSPAVGHLMALYEIKPDQIPHASGPRGRLLKGDVLAYLKSQGKTATPKKQPPQPFKLSSTTPQTQTSTTPGSTQKPGAAGSPAPSIVITQGPPPAIPASYLKQTVDVTRLIQVCQRLSKATGKRVTATDAVMHAAALAYRAVPELGEVKQGVTVALAIAAGQKPCHIADVDTKGMASLAAELKSLAKGHSGDSQTTTPDFLVTYREGPLASYAPVPPAGSSATLPAWHLVVGTTYRKVAPAQANQALADALDFLVKSGSPLAPTPEKQSTITPSISSSNQSKSDLLDELTGSARPTASGASSRAQPTSLLTLGFGSLRGSPDAKLTMQFMKILKAYVEEPERMLM
ncbi:hypothetical protein IWQ62_003001 [Dispira parvispora]|uniref:Dihydrolipoamide acetyltransferase component of pyruvate dehydrogenase complex n=1 Tax=Dispira parvispora TaxID=1520584 RepID=A0A9W8E7G1_9FUNG|nr:hypothetical protein IWQ62_003001 [Dispira parvispora]